MEKTRKVRVLVTGGPTRAYLDEVRYLSNYSTGEVAYRTCSAIKKRGAEVVAVVGPTAFDFSKLGVRVRNVITSEEMHREVLRLCRSFRPDVVVFAAAVLDFVPVRKESGKVSSQKSSWRLELKAAPKTIDMVGKKYPAIRRIGFKLEWKKTANPRLWGAKHLRARGLDALVLNYLPEVTTRSHRAYLLDSGGGFETAQTKQEIASWIATQSLRQGLPR